MYKRNGHVIGREAAGLVADYSAVKRRTPPSARDRVNLGLVRPRVKTSCKPRNKPVKVQSLFCSTCAQFLYPNEVQQNCARCGTTN